jgi:hypothetical protein
MGKSKILFMEIREREIIKEENPKKPNNGTNKS